MCNEFIYDPGGGDERSKRTNTSPAMSWDDEVEAQERYRETGRVSNTSYSHTKRNNEKNGDYLSEDSETDSDYEGAQKDNSTIVNARVPAIADPLQTRRVRDKRGSKDAGKFSTSTPNETKDNLRFFFLFFFITQVLKKAVH